jgi:FKBP-type peptidyl-prolyl cis-trans isomerase FklB
MANQCDNGIMLRPFTLAVSAVAAGMILLGIAQAQQSPSAAAPQTPSPQALPTKTTPKPPGAKTGTTTPRTPTVLTLKTQKDKASYAIGLNIGKSMHKDSVDVDTAILLRGLKDGMAGAKPLLTDDEARAVMVALQTDLRKKQEEKMLVQGEANKKAGETFLAENKTKDGVVTLPSGLQYKILTEGTGPKPAPTDTVVCNYKGTLLDNTEFDSSYKRGQPATFPVSGVIKGWTEALQLMPVGSKWQLFIPSDLAYGARGGPGGGIGPNATLVFEVELMSIQPKAEVQTPKSNPSPDSKPNPNQ